MANFFNILNKKIIVGAGRLSNTSSKEAISLNSERVYSDLSKLASYNNEVIYESFRKLCSKPQFPYDVVESGISGNTIVTYLESDGNSSSNSGLYWNSNNNRPNTIKESFDYLLANLGVSQIVRETVQPDLENISNIIRCNTLNLDKLRKDIAGCDYNFDCSETESYRWSLSKHVYELFTQGLITGHVPAQISELNSTCGNFEYPTLALTVLTNNIGKGPSLISQDLIESCAGGSSSLETQLASIQSFIGMNCEESLSELSTDCATYALDSSSRSLKEYIKKIIERLCNLPEGQGIDAVYLGVKEPAIGEDNNIEDVKVTVSNDIKTGVSLQYHHSSVLEDKKHYFKMNGEESLIQATFAPDSFTKEDSWEGVDYSNPIPFTLFSYSTNPNLDSTYVSSARSSVTTKRTDNKIDGLSFFEEVSSYLENQAVQYNYDSIGGVIRNDLTVCDRNKDTGTSINKYTEELDTYHITGSGNNYTNHLQIAGHAPVICLGPVDFGDVLVPVPLLLQQQLIPGVNRAYGFVCSKKILSETYIEALYSGTVPSELNYKIGISLSSNKDYISATNFSNIALANTFHADIVNNIITKAKPALNVSLTPVTGGGMANPLAYLSLQYMRIML